MQSTTELNSDDRNRILYSILSESGLQEIHKLPIHFDLITHFYFLIYCEDFSRTKLLKTDYKLCDMFLFRLLQST